MAVAAHPFRTAPGRRAPARRVRRRRPRGIVRAGGGRTPIRIALDWTPNTNHTGLFVAQQEGWFEHAGLDVEFLPYNNTPPDTLVGSGAAEFGISFQDSFTYAKAGGVDAVSVMAIVQHWATQIAVRADRPTSPPRGPRRQDLRRLRRRVRGARRCRR